MQETKPCDRSDKGLRDSIVFWSKSSFGYQAIAKKVGISPEELYAWLAEDELLREETSGANVDENRLYTITLAAACQLLQGAITVKEIYDCRESDTVPIRVEKTHSPPEPKFVLELLKALNPAKFGDGQVQTNANGRLMIESLLPAEYKLKTNEPDET